MRKKHFRRRSVSFVPMPLPLLSMTVALALLAVSWFAWERARYASARRERRLHYRRWVQEAPGLSPQPRQDAIPLDRMNPQRALQIRLDAEAAARRAWTAGAGEPANP